MSDADSRMLEAVAEHLGLARRHLADLVVGAWQRRNAGLPGA